jgi:hypothetical protein
LAGGIHAQEDSLLQQPFHLSLFTPLSTNGLQSYQTVNDFSIAMFYSGSAGVSGLEMSGFANYTHYYVDGVQLAGFANIVRQRAEGFQAAGFSNVLLGSLKGIQAAGFANVATADIEGLQLSGFANIGKDLEGAQLSGFANVAGYVDGLQLAGFSNISQKVDGAQISGFLNIAETVDGLQLGFINIVDSIQEGLPIGFLSIVGSNGYYKLDAWGDELLHANLAIKLGVPQFYNIFGIGTRFNFDPSLLAGTYGVGTEIKLSGKWSINPELLFQSFLDDELFEQSSWNSLTQFRPLIKYQITPGFGIYLAPSVKLFIQEGENNYFPSGLEPWIIAEKEDDDIHRIFWFGITAGFSFF